MKKLNDKGSDLMFLKAPSYSGYLPGAVTSEEFAAIWELAKMGPTPTNQIPTRIIWCLSPASKDWLAALVTPANTGMVRNARAVAVIGMDIEFYEQLPKLFPHADARPWFAGKREVIAASAFRNASLQGAYLIMTARALGFDTGPMAGFDNAEFFPEGTVKPNFIFAVGHGDPASIFGRLPRLAFEEANTVI